jgi:hypothetical protein
MDPHDFCLVKFGDTRKGSTRSGYRARVALYELHGNAKMRKVGKKLQLALLQGLAAKRMAVRVGTTETYVLKRAMGDALFKAVRDAIGSEGGRVSVDELMALMSRTFNNSDSRRIEEGELSDADVGSLTEEMLSF